MTLTSWPSDSLKRLATASVSILGTVLATVLLRLCYRKE